MTQNLYIPLNNRAVISITGADKKTFLQGIITNDINKLDEKNSIYALMLTPQGKFLYDFFISEREDLIFIDCAADKISEIRKKLSLYKLRSDVKIEDASETYEVVALIGDGVYKAVEDSTAGYTRKFCKGVAYIDPRSKNMFARSVIERENNYQSFIAYEFEKGELTAYEDVRIGEKIPEGGVDIIYGQDFPLDFGLDKIGAIDYKKGCYVGQEVTARVYHRGKIRKQLYLAKCPSALPFGADVTSDEIKIGKTLSSTKTHIILLLNQEKVANLKNSCKVSDTDITLLD